MIVTPDIYFHTPRMNIGVHYDQRQPAFSSMAHHPWMSSSNTLQVKEEPRDDAEYGQGRSLTPPYLSNYPGATAYQEDTPPKDPPPASSGDNLESSNSEGEYGEFGDSQMQLEVTTRSGMIAEEKLKCPVCKFTCSVRPQFNEHLRIHKFRCSECKNNAESATDLKEHLKSVHGIDDSENSIDKDPNKPNMNAQGKIKTFTCRHCPFTVITKKQLWNHLRTHIKPERILMCPCCEFVTEYKHHLEYHLRNHWKHKPYSCDKCPYRCVNKSMLSSHMKSHSNVYQYRCINCNYATKYCHSLKTHLKKYDHEPGVVLNPDGSPNPLPIIDVYGRRRGPKQKPKHEQKPKQENKPVQEQQPQIEFSSPPQVPGIFHPYSTLMQTQMIYYNNLSRFGGFPFSQGAHVEETNNNVEKIPLDLSRSEPMKEDSNEEPPAKNRRKGKAFKLNRIALRLQQQVEKEEYQPEQQQQVEKVDHLHIHQVVEKVDHHHIQHQAVEKAECQPEQQHQVEMEEYQQKESEKQECRIEQQQLEKQHNLPDQPQQAQTSMDVEPPQSPEVKSCEADSEQKTDMTDVKINYTCVYCGLGFSTYAFYTVHMGYHGYDDPFKCNMCGKQTEDALALYLHIAKNEHP